MSYNLNEIIASTCLCDVNEVNLNITNNFESMEVFENLYDEPIHTKKTVNIETKDEEPNYDDLEYVDESEEEELSEEEFLDF